MIPRRTMVPSRVRTGEAALRLDRGPSMSDRPLRTAELLAVGAELTVGGTRDTNSGEIARSLGESGVGITRINVLPDRLRVVASAFRAALGRADLVVSTGGLGPTPDDLTREAIARVLGETLLFDPDLEAWLRGLWTRRGLPFPEINRKQAWLIPSARALPNPHGTAPGWWIDRPDGRVVVMLPGPPREMRPMWFERVLPDLRRRRLGSYSEPDPAPDRDRRIAGRRSARRSAPSAGQSRDRHACPRGCRGCPAVGIQPTGPVGRGSRSMALRLTCSPSSATTCGPGAARPGPKQSRPSSSALTGPSRSARPAQMRPWPRCWADWPGCAAPIRRQAPVLASDRTSGPRCVDRARSGDRRAWPWTPGPRGDDMVITIGGNPTGARTGTPARLPRRRPGTDEGGPPGRRPPCSRCARRAPERPPDQEIDRTGASLRAAATLIRAATCRATSTRARAAGPGSRWATAGMPASAPWRTVMSSGIEPR